MGSMHGPRYNRYRGVTIRAITGFYCINMIKDQTSRHAPSPNIALAVKFILFSMFSRPANIAIAELVS